MNRYITVATFQYPHQAHVIKSKLESYGVTVFLKDELTVQAHNFLSNAVGGIKLQIMESDLEKALPLLKEAGLIENNEEESLGYLNWIDERTNKIPIINTWPVEIRSIFIAAIVGIMALVTWFVVQLPTKEERLNKQQKIQEAQLSDELEKFHLPLIDSLLYAEPQEAVNYSKKLLQSTYPKNNDLHLMIAYGYVEMDSFKLASQYFGTSMSYGFRHPRGLSTMAYCQIQLRNYDKAVDYLKEAVEINKDYKTQLAEVYGMKKEWKNAEKYYSEYIADRERWDMNTSRNIEFQKVKIKRDSIRGLIE